MAFNFRRGKEKVLQNSLTSLPKPFENALLPIALLTDDLLGKKDHRVEGSDGKMAVKHSLLKKDETSWDVVAQTILADETGLQ